MPFILQPPVLPEGSDYQLGGTLCWLLVVCQDCHNATGSKKDVKRYQVHSDVCGY